MHPEEPTQRPSHETLVDALTQRTPDPWESFPTIPLYMDQVLSIVNPTPTGARGDEGLTPAMVNNYIKEGLLPRATGKRYHATHLAGLNAISALKKVLSVKDIGILLGELAVEEDVSGFYQDFHHSLTQALAQSGEDIAQSDSPAPQLALELALRSYAYQMACFQVLDQISPPVTKEKSPSKEKKKEGTP